ncbi:MULTISPECIES: DNA-formamidopyrimidine glycosylase [unclassified Prochlorococcus]|uniref:DNA-formamidopyrimidine glycosylase n=1 Tax=unclassified Prochlorococcus TaxID=2627481 RepID=UPI000533B85C|nr:MULTISPECIES: DNA-formamidopyrimidine glycosylase [unclassified Prochlorococcus]KGG29476.1 Formamidopyrimidine-DNA glycosylase [Prochlorococcus sp. MIT 0701]KGG30048.1 Formamidopyrimidine-DNA glycosylase [Prochlorococcus sp. MIT 0703]KGG30380.1 Formamidopyrimidine-DNA glycosylase [Prochlorococcus sp. MIT 0702]
MPELPEVETVRRGLADRLVDFQIDQVEVCRERAIASPGGSGEFIKMLCGMHVGSWLRRGKYLMASLHHDFAQLSADSEPDPDGGWWGVHLRMTGQFQWHEAISSPCPHTRVRIWNKKGKELRFVDTRSFGQMWWVPPGNAPETIITGLQKLGPEPFSSAFNSSYLRQRLKGSKRPIKSALLDQSIVAGAGNIYTDESLFAARIRPHTPSGQLKSVELERLCDCLTEVLRVSIGAGGTTFSDFRDLEGINGNYGGQAWVYRRGGQACRICSTPIRRESLCGRGTHWCPNCQR